MLFFLAVRAYFTSFTNIDEWSTALFFNNFWFDDNTVQGHMWLVAVFAQLYLVTPFIAKFEHYMKSTLGCLLLMMISGGYGFAISYFRSERKSWDQHFNTHLLWRDR
jgi:surface polysaccharide O-acyltransferase-like enzyme